MATDGGTLDVASGYIPAYRLFDVAYAIDLGKAEDVWARTVRTGSSRGRLGTSPKAIAFGEPPVAFGLGAIMLPLPGSSAHTLAYPSARVASRSATHALREESRPAGITAG